VDISQIEVVFSGKNSANIYAKDGSTLYGGEPVEVEFLLDLHAVLTNTKLGIVNGKKEPTGSEVLNALLKENPDLDISQLTPKLSTKTPGEVLIVVKE